MRPPDGADIRAPEFPGRMTWLNVAMLRMSTLVKRNKTVLIEFFDFARINSHHTLPYLREWHERYQDKGLQVIGIHCPGYSFGVDAELVEARVREMGIDYAVLLDPGFEVWRDYENQGWPGRYLFDGRGILRWVQYGEGGYTECELAIQEVLAELDASFSAPEPMAPVRPEDAPGILLEAQTADIALPRDAERLELEGRWSEGEDYLEASAAGALARVASFSAGTVHAVLSGDEVEPGLHESDGVVEAGDGGLRLHGFQFSPAPT